MAWTNEEDHLCAVLMENAVMRMGQPFLEIRSFVRDETTSRVSLEDGDGIGRSLKDARIDMRIFAEYDRDLVYMSWILSCALRQCETVDDIDHVLQCGRQQAAYMASCIKSWKMTDPVEVEDDEISSYEDRCVAVMDALLNVMMFVVHYDDDHILCQPYKRLRT